jgi:hypothetical protein
MSFAAVKSVLVAVMVCVISAALFWGCGSSENDRDPSGNGDDAGKPKQQSERDSPASRGSSSNENSTAQDMADFRHERVRPSKREVEAFQPVPGRDNSVKTFGREMEGRVAEEVVTAMRSFLEAVAVADHRRICAGLSQEAIEEVEGLVSGRPGPGKCSAGLSAIMAPRQNVEGEVRSAAEGVIYQVRVEDETAFILFTPRRRGVPSFFVMRREDGDWKATGVSAGSPINPEP